MVMDTERARNIAARRAPVRQAAAGQATAQHPRDLEVNKNTDLKEGGEAVSGHGRGHDSVTREEDPRNPTPSVAKKTRKPRQKSESLRITIEVPREFERCLTLAAMDAEDAGEFERGLREPQINAFIRNEMKKLFEEFFEEYPNKKARVQ